MIMVRGSDLFSKMTPETVRLLVDYDAATGIARWRHRTPELMASIGATSNQIKYFSWSDRLTGQQIGALNDDGYLTCCIFRKTIALHRLIWFMQFGRWPVQVDHINGIKTDNRLENLREVSLAENSRNHPIRKANKTGVMGVSYIPRSRRWRATIAHRQLGEFDDFDLAVAARRQAERELGFHPNHGRAPAPVEARPTRKARAPKGFDYSSFSAAFSYDPSTGAIWLQGADRQLPAFTTRLNKGCLAGSFNGRMFQAHRVAWLLQTGSWPSGAIVHRDGDLTNNRWENLSERPRSSEPKIRRAVSRSRDGVPGVHWHARDQKWRARISVKGRSIEIGRFERFEDAVAARVSAASRPTDFIIHRA